MIFGWKNDPRWVMVKHDLQKEKMERLMRLAHLRFQQEVASAAARQIQPLEVAENRD